MAIKRYLRMGHICVSIIFIMMGGGGGGVSQEKLARNITLPNVDEEEDSRRRREAVASISVPNIPPPPPPPGFKNQTKDIINQTNFIAGIPEEVPFPLPSFLNEENPETLKRQQELGEKVSVTNNM